MFVISDSDSADLQSNLKFSWFKFVSIYMYLTFWRRIKLNCKFTKELTLHTEWTSISVIYSYFTVNCQYHSCFVVLGFHHS